MGYDEIYETYMKVSKDNVKRDLFNHSTDSSEEIIEEIKNSKIAIYTAFTGDYDTLKEVEYRDENCDYICFSDNPDLKSDTWEIIQMDESTLDNNRKAKQYKILPHKYLKDYDYSFWLDGTFQIKGSIREYIYKFIKADSSMLCVVHTERDCIYEEYEASKIIPRYPRLVMEEQVETYRKEGFPEKYGLAVMGAIFRKHTDNEVIKVMEDWWDETIKYTNQDQLSFAYVCWKNNFHPSVSQIYYWDNEYWAKNKEDYHHKVVFQTPVTSDNLRAKIGDVRNLEDTVELSDEELYLLINDVKGMAGYRIDTSGRANYLAEEYYKMMSSNSMKLTKPLRMASNLSRNIKKNLEIIKHPKIISTYERIKNLDVIDLDRYGELHPDEDDMILHYIQYASLNDKITDKMHYIKPIFDLYYYQTHNSVFDDPLIHYVTQGFFDDLPINKKYPDFVDNLDESLSDQIDRFVGEKLEDELESNHYITSPDILIDYMEYNREFKTNTIKVAVFLEDSFNNMNACPYIRIHTPFVNLSKSGDYHFFIYDKEIMPLVDVENITTKIFDVVVIQRVNPFAVDIVKKAKRLGMKIIYETDDDLMDISSDNPSFTYIQENYTKIQRVIRAADEVVVSTNELKKRIEHDSITIIQNYYLDELLPLRPFTLSGEKRIKIGYFGTLTHTADLELIHNVVVKVRDEFLKKGVKVDFEVIGASLTMESDWYSVEKLPYYPMSITTFMKWMERKADWDIGIVPLTDTSFNKCKSELKYIEFTALGVPVIASNISTYAETIDDGVNGYLASNEDEWIDKLSILIDDMDLRHGMLNNAREDIINNYSLKSSMKQWDEILKS